MSRLYGRLRSDRRKTDAMVGANHHLETTLTWGSAGNPQKAIDVLLVWNKDAEHPTLTVDVPEGLAVLVYADGGLQYRRRLA